MNDAGVVSLVERVRAASAVSSSLLSVRGFHVVELMFVDRLWRSECIARPSPPPPQAQHECGDD